MNRISQVIALLAVTASALQSPSGDCLYEELVVETVTKRDLAWGDAQYFLFEYPESSQSAIVIGSKSKTVKGEDSDLWCVKPGQYLLYLSQSTIVGSSDYAISSCGTDIKPGSIVMFSMDMFGRCSVLLDMVASDFSPLMANRFTARGLEVIAAMDDFGSFDFSNSLAFSDSFDFSFDISFDFSFDMSLSTSFSDSYSSSSSADFVTNSPTSTPTVTYSPSSSPSSEPTNVPTQVLHPTHTPTLSPTPVPTSAPTVQPTSAPTTKPTFAPTSLPTVAPTRKPTASPTVSPPPTVAPTRSPTLAPTRKPTARPTMAPTTLLSTLQPSARITECYADCTYKGQSKPASQWTRSDYCAFYKSTGCTASKVGSYSCVPTCLNDCPDAYCDTFSTLSLSCTSTGSTYADKVGLEDTCLDTYADTAATETQLEFDSNMAYEGLDATEFANSQDAKDSAIVAMSQSMVGVPADKISITNIEATTRRALSSDISRRLAAGTKVTYKIRTTLEALGYTQAQSTQAYNSLKSQITESVNNGNFMTIFKAAAQEKGVTIVDSATVDTSSVLFSDPTTTIIQTASPTMAPTPNKNNDDGVDTGVIIGAVIGSVVGFAIIVAALYYFMFQYKTQDQKEMQFRLATNRAHQGQELSGGLKDGHEMRKASNV